MSQENKSILNQANAAVRQGDYESFLSYCTEDVKWIFVGERTLNGKEAVRQFMNKMYIEPPKFRVARMIAEGDLVMAMGDIALKDETGNETLSSYCDVWRIRDGKLSELRAFVVKIDGAGSNEP